MADDRSDDRAGRKRRTALFRQRDVASNPVGDANKIKGLRDRSPNLLPLFSRLAL